MISLYVVGVSFSQFQAGVYTLILAEENGNRKIPVIIGTPEAHSITNFLEGLRPPRPLTHDLFVSFAEAWNIKLQQVNIYKYIEGVFYSELIFNKGKKTICIDSRTSDALALAIRFQATIFTTEEIMRKTGVVLADEGGVLEETNEPVEKNKVSFKSMNLEGLQMALKEAIEKEDYEEASYIRDLIKER